MKTSILLTLFLALSFCSSAQSPYGMGMDFDDAAYEQVPKKARLTRNLDIVPQRASIKQYAPAPGNQGMHGTCTAWATAYCGRTIVEAIKNNWSDKALITSRAYSPAFLFRMLLPGDAECKGGSSIQLAFNLMKEKGVIPFKELAVQCTPAITPSQLTAASVSRIKDYMKLFDFDTPDQVKIQAVKKSISERKPVIIGMICPPSFLDAKEVWQPKEQALQSYGGHAMCVVGYDDTKFGGAFEIQNSWGTFWGTGGYIWIRYADFANFNKYAYEFIDLPESKPAVPDLSGELKLVLASGNTMPATLQVSTRGLKVVPAKTAPGPFSFYQNTETYRSGTRFRIYISNNQPAYVYALSTDLTNEVTKIFPYEEGISAALTNKRNDVAIPDEDHFIEFDNQPGKDILCVLYSREELDINQIIQQLKIQKGSFSERLYAVMKDKLVEPQNIQFAKDKIGFQGFSKGKQVITMMVELNHIN